MLKDNKNAWVRIYKSNQNAKIRLFCFHYAGGAASAYNSWIKYLPENMELCAIQLPGRENRIMEPPYQEMDSLINELVTAITPYINKPYVFYGHSMGANVCFELSLKLRKLNIQMPLGFFASGSKAPQYSKKDNPIHLLPEKEFLDKIKEFNGTPEEVFQYPELLSIYMPILRADLTVEETYEYQEEAPFDFPFLVYGGIEDKDVSFDEILGWKIHTSNKFEVKQYPGGHFFIRDKEEEFVNDILENIKIISKV